MCMAQLVLQDRQQICNDTHSLLQQCNSLIHLQVTPHGLVDRVELRLCPHELGSIQDRALKVYVDSENEQLANLHVDFFSREVDAARRGDLRRYALRRGDCGVD